MSLSEQTNIPVHPHSEVLAHAYTNEASNSVKIVKIQKHRCILHRDRGHAEKATNWVSQQHSGKGQHRESNTISGPQGLGTREQHRRKHRGILGQ